MAMAAAHAAETVALAISAPAPAARMEYKDESGAMQAADGAGHRLTAVHFWATWCVPCLKELPEVDATAAAYKDKGLRVIAIAIENDAAKVRKFYGDKGIRHLAVALDGANMAFRAAKLKGLPGTVFLNEKGEEIARADGPLDWKAKETITFLDQELP